MAMSPLTLGLLAVLAYRTYQGKGRLADMLGRQEPAQAGAGAGDGRLNDNRADNRAPGQQQGGGGLGDILGNIFGGGASPGGRNMAPDMRGGQQAGMGGGGLGGMLGGLLAGGAAGGLLSGGLGGLLQQFQQNGRGDVANSWIGRGQNQPIAPEELESAVGKDTVQQLADQSGRPYMDVLSELSTSLPDTVDQLTPEGRIPTAEEVGKWV